MNLLKAGTRVIATATTDVFAEPGKGQAGTITASERAEVVEQTPDQVFTRVDFGDASPAVWVETAALKVDALPPPATKFDPDEFVDECVAVAQLINEMPSTSPCFIDARGVVARALLLTDMKPSKASLGGEELAGPLQLSATEWAAFLTSGAPLAQGFRPKDRGSPLAQIRGAAWSLLADRQDFDRLRASPSPQDQILAPSHVELLLAQVLGAAVRSEGLASIESLQPDRALGSAFGELLPAGEAPSLLDRLKAWAGAGAMAKSVRGFLDDFGKVLTRHLSAADQRILLRTGPPPVVKDPKVKVLTSMPRNLAAVPKESPVPFASFDASPDDLYWPVITADPRAMVISHRTTSDRLVGGPGREFLADRLGGRRNHVGVDVYCEEDDVVVACADGEIVNFFSFYTRPDGERTYALLVKHAGVVVNYGEVKPTAPQEFKWAIGSAVEAGQPIARVSGTRMIHFETYRPGTDRTYRWMRADPRPERLLNPTRLLMGLAVNARRIVKGGDEIKKPGRAAMPSTDGKNVRDRDFLALARTIYGEARGESQEGRIAVANVVMNRVKIGPKRFGKTVEDVCLQDKQFSCWNENDPNRTIIQALQPGANPRFDECCEAADLVLRGQVGDNSGEATHYYATYIAEPSWVKPKAKHTVTIGRHKFFTDVD
ncbi:cell wall hydrolase [Bosea sp. ASV33]|uniref:cell wall hydrolase n=1 Tax=Bosea sp. ASV33 TaxID=2795106 RepID=UPI0018EA9574|nr:cell wall hydrolase [Bosea sp. ASV33]